MRLAPRRGPCVLLLAGGLLLLLGFAGCSRAPDPWREAKQGQKRVLVTFAPLYCLTHAVAGDDAYVLSFLTKQGPHDYVFSPTDAVKARSADLLVYNGLGLDDRFTEKMNKVQSKAVPVLDVGATLPKDLLRKDEDDDEDDHAKKDDHGHQHGDYDPHIWLGPPQAMVMVDTIAGKLSEIDAAHAAGYKERASKVKQQLQQLLDDGRAKFKDKQNREVVTMHESFGYFADAFGLKVAGSIQATPNQQVDAARLGKLDKLCKEKNVRVITFEPQYSDAEPKLLQKGLAQRGLEVRLAEFDPLETAPVPEGKINPPADYYFEKMRANIDNLAKALP